MSPEAVMGILREVYARDRSLDSVASSILFDLPRYILRHIISH